MSTSPPLPPADYIAWVQRALNRILGQSLVTDGADSTTYRDLIELFQRSEHLAVTRGIASIDQDRLIQRSHADVPYAAWARGALARAGHAQAALPNAVKSFQQASGLGADGWLGARTELALIARVGTHPPGHQPKATPKPRPRRPPRTSLLDRFLDTDPTAARLHAPAQIEPFPASAVSWYRDEIRIRQRLAAAARVARYATLRLSALLAKADAQARWNDPAEPEHIWFGGWSAAKARKVSTTFDAIAALLGNRHLRVVGDLRLNAYGEASPLVRRVRLGTQWLVPGWDTLAGPDPERVQTFVHEAAHIAGRFNAAEAKGYGPDAARALANDGMRATRNADSYGYYAIELALDAP